MSQHNVPEIRYQDSRHHLNKNLSLKQITSIQ